MKITLNKDDFANNVLLPVSKLSDNVSIDFYYDESSTPWAKTMVTSSDNSTILLSKSRCSLLEEPTKCIIPECKTFLRLFSGIPQDNLCLHINQNKIEYKEKDFSFKYFLLDESYVVNKKSISENKINSLCFDTTFKLTKQKLSEIIKYNSIVPEAEKLYFYTTDNSVVVKLGDEQRSNVNEITTEASMEFEGPSIDSAIPINIQNVLLFSFNLDEILVSINQSLKIFKFETSNLTYIVSGLVK